MVSSRFLTSGIKTTPVKTNQGLLLPVVVTRPAPDHVRLLNELERQGRPSVHAPAFRLIAQESSLNAAERAELMVKTSALIAVSPTAARRSVQVFGTQQLSGCKIFTPGAASASVFAEHGLSVTVPEAYGTSEAMLVLPALQNVQGKVIVIAAAPGGRSLLAETLESRGARVIRVELYRRERLKPSVDFLRFLKARFHHPEDFYSMITSAMTFDVLRAGLPKALAEVWMAGRFVVSSDRLRAIVQSAGSDRVILAASAADADMLRVLSD